eukprot:2392870-Prymnesium_polylepis.1
MATHGLSQSVVAAATKLSSSGKLCLWLGRACDRLARETEAEADVLIAAYLDGVGAPAYDATAAAAAAITAAAAAAAATDRPVDPAHELL